MNETSASAERFVAALATRDLDDIAAVLAPDVRFRFLIPSGPDEVRGAQHVAAKFGSWFGDAQRLEVEDIRIEPLPGRASARYRFKVDRQRGSEVIEQQTYVDVDEKGQIAAIDLLCSGFRQATLEQGGSAGMHHFDAGTMGCADGLAAEFRRRILAIPIGEILVVETSDPAAKEDLPPLARMMGHVVHSIERHDDGRLMITVERGR